MTAIQRFADRMPERAKPPAERLLYLATPWLSWRRRRRVGATRRAFVDRFFESDDEYETYEREFFDGRIVDICRDASRQFPEGESIYDAHMDECARLYALVRKHEPETIVETGVYHGVSTTSLLLALETNGSGTLHSLDPSPLLNRPRTRSGPDRRLAADRVEDYRRGRPSCCEAGTHRLPRGFEPGWIVPTDLRHRWEFTVGHSQAKLPEVLESAGDVDCFVHDSEHSTTGMCFEFDLAWEHLRPGGLLCSLHVDWNDAFDTFVRERACDHGRLAYTYNGLDDYPEACSSGYAIKPPR